MPDLAIEVQSEDQSDAFMQEKGLLYLQKGVQLVWLIYADKGIVEVLTPTSCQLLTTKDNLSGGDVLPGLDISIAEIFPSAEDMEAE